MNAETKIAPPLIAEPGAYLEIATEDYHRNPALLPGPSLSSSGAKKLLAQSPLHFWFDSPLNPQRPPEEQKPHFNIGKAAHDMLLLSDRWPEFYYVTPDGFNASHHKKWAEEIAAYEAAIEAGKCILRYQDAETVRAVADAINRNDYATKALTNGVTEETIAWQDPRTGVWLRARPDFRPHSVTEQREVRIIADLKFVAPTHATPEGFRKAIANFGYHQSAAFYFDGIKAVFGQAPTHWLHIVVEKEPPYSVSLYELPAEDIERGRFLNRKAIDLFAECLKRDEWPGYADKPRAVGLPEWERRNIENFDADSLAFSAAA